ncbi:MAG: hypothetical protein IH802_11670 [Nitrospinae bacterium]|nr:hypothetical protein [Nitrospinota bacterium]
MSFHLGIGFLDHLVQNGLNFQRDIGPGLGATGRPEGALGQLQSAGNGQAYRIERGIGRIQEQAVIVYIAAKLLDLGDRTAQGQGILHAQRIVRRLIDPLARRHTLVGQKQILRNLEYIPERIDLLNLIGDSHDHNDLLISIISLFRIYILCNTSNISSMTVTMRAEAA